MARTTRLHFRLSEQAARDLQDSAAFMGVTVHEATSMALLELDAVPHREKIKVVTGHNDTTTAPKTERGSITVSSGVKKMVEGLVKGTGTDTSTVVEAAITKFRVAYAENVPAMLEQADLVELEAQTLRTRAREIERANFNRRLDELEAKVSALFDLVS